LFFVLFGFICLHCFEFFPCLFFNGQVSFKILPRFIKIEELVGAENDKQSADYKSNSGMELQHRVQAENDQEQSKPNSSNTIVIRASHIADCTKCSYFINDEKYECDDNRCDEK